MLKLKILKMLVFIMTFSLIFGIIILAFRLTGKIKKNGNEATEATLNQPTGSSFGNIIAADGKLHITVTGGNRPDRIIIFDTETNRTISTISIN